MKGLKRFVSVLLVLCTIITTAGTIPAYANTKQIQEDWFAEMNSQYVWKNKALVLGGNECVAVANHYMQKIFGTNWYNIYRADFAKQIYASTSNAYFEKIPQTPLGIPQKGDIVVWNASLGGGAGHIAVVESADINTITVIEQNGNRITRRWVTRHTYGNYAHVIGWLRPKPEKVIGGYPAPPQNPKQPFDEVSEGHFLDGEHYIIPVSSHNKVLATWDNQNHNGQDVIYYGAWDTPNYKWRFERQSDGSFIIANAQNGKVLDVMGAQIINGAKVQLWDRVGGDNQRFYLHRFDDGSYRIIAKHSGYSLSMPGDSNSINMIQWYRDMGISQRFVIHRTTPIGQVPSSSAPEIKNGIYAIKSNVDQNKYLSVEPNSNGVSNVFINSKTNTDEQKWRFEKLDDGSFKITNIQNGKVLDVEAGIVKYDTKTVVYHGVNRTNISAHEWNGNDNQRWIIYSNGNGTYKIISKRSGFNVDIDVAGTNIPDRANIQQYIDNGNRAQQFYLVRLDQQNPEPNPQNPQNPNPQQPQGATLTVQSMSATPNSEITVPITISKNPGIASLKAKIDYDRTKLELVSTEIADSFKSLPGANEFAGDNYPIIFNWILTNDNSSLNGVFARMKFRVKANAPLGETEIKLTYDQDDVFNQDLENVNFAIVNSKINISNRKPGDIDGDGRVNNKDALLLFRYISSGNTGNVDVSVYDLDGNGVVNNRDSIKLFKFISGNGSL